MKIIAYIVSIAIILGLIILGIYDISILIAFAAVGLIVFLYITLAIAIFFILKKYLQ